MLLPSLSLQFRVHTRVLLTLLIALLVTAAMWAEPMNPPLARANCLTPHGASPCVAAVAP